MGLVARSERAPDPVPTGIGADLPLRKLSFQAMGTQCDVQYAAPGGDAQAAQFESQAVQWVNAFEAKYSRFKSESLIGLINSSAGREWITVDAEAEQFFKLCDTLHFMTQGVLDPTMLPLIKLWNWKAAPPVVPSPAQVAAAKALVGWQKVQRKPGQIFLPQAGMALDFGGFGKEFAVDRVAQIGAECGLNAVLVDFGHDLRTMGVPPGRPAWHIGLEDPKNPGATAGSMAITGNKAVASSGDYLRCFVSEGRRYGHIIDPRTGWPVANGCLQATVVASTCLQAGVLATTAFVLGIPQGIAFIQNVPGAEGLLVSEQVRAQTRGFYHYVVS
jgi:thiamine biosynthesis lipoprotein